MCAKVRGERTEGGRALNTLQSITSLYICRGAGAHGDAAASAIMASLIFHRGKLQPVFSLQDGRVGMSLKSDVHLSYGSIRVALSRILGPRSLGFLIHVLQAPSLYLGAEAHNRFTGTLQVCM